jgi:hypothetical protein
MGRLIGIVAIIVVIALNIDRCVPVTDLSRSSTESSSEGCRIKGNISLNGEHIYHVPGGEWYDETRIDRSRGERWFCSEDEAQAAGWRRAYE